MNHGNSILSLLQHRVVILKKMHYFTPSDSEVFKSTYNVKQRKEFPRVIYFDSTRKVTVLVPYFCYLETLDFHHIWFFHSVNTPRDRHYIFKVHTWSYIVHHCVGDVHVIIQFLVFFLFLFTTRPYFFPQKCHRRPFNMFYLI